MDDGAKTEWLGLWCQREGVYSGNVLKKADIPKYAKLIVRYNKFYQKDGNRPRFVYCFASGPAANALTINIDSEEYMTFSEAQTLNEKVEELAEIMRKGKRNGYVMQLPSESQARAGILMNKAIALIEEMTGEEWDFSYITF